MATIIEWNELPTDFLKTTFEYYRPSSSKLAVPVVGPPPSNISPSEPVTALQERATSIAEQKLARAALGHPVSSTPNRVQRTGLVDFPDRGGPWLRRPSGRSSHDDPRLAVEDIHRFGLRTGDLVFGDFDLDVVSGTIALSAVHAVNDQPYCGQVRPYFEDIDAVHPDRQIYLETRHGALSCRLIDLFAPIGFGQRGLLVSPPRAGKTTILTQIGQAVSNNFPEARLMLLLVGERPEEITDLRQSLPTAAVFASSFDGSKVEHSRMARLAIEHATRCAEQGIDAVVLFDSITRLVSAENLQSTAFGGKTLSGGVDAQALDNARNLFGAARAYRDAGSVTIIATCLTATGSRGDDMVYEQLKGTGNLEIRLSGSLATAGTYPAIDLLASGTRRAEQLLHQEALWCATEARRQLAGAAPESRADLYQRLFRKLSRFATNAEFLDSVRQDLRHRTTPEGQRTR